MTTTIWNGIPSGSTGRGYLAAPRGVRGGGRTVSRAPHTLAFAAKVEVMRSLDGFSVCEDESLFALAEAAVMRRLKRRQTIGAVRAGEHLLGIVQGLAGVRLAEDDSGGELILDLVGAGRVVADWCWAGVSGSTGAELFAIEESIAMLLPRRAFEAALAVDPVLATKVVEQLARSRVRAVALAAQNARFGVPDRLYCRLVELAHAHGRVDGGSIVVDHGLTQTVLAAFACASRENVNRHLNEWRARRWIEFTRRSITVLDPMALTRSVAPAARRVGFGAGDGRLPLRVG